MTADSAPRRPRRRPGEAREALVVAARDAFVDIGYQGASLRQIAARAGTTQAVLYRYFPSKAELFEESVIGPFKAFVTALTEDWRATSISDMSTPDLIRGFTESLYDFTLTHRGLIIAMLAADAHGGDSTGDAKTSFAQTIGAVIRQALADAASRGWADIDVEVAVPLTMSLIISTALLDDWLFTRAKRPGRRRILKEMVRYEIRAITGGYR